MPHSPLSDATLKRAATVRLVALDVDGVLTDGGIIWDENGVETKRFSVRDGMGIRLLLDAGYSVGIITARRSRLVERRAEELSLTFLHQKVDNKWSCLHNELQSRGLSPEHVAFMGDDLVDLPVLRRVGFGAAPADAVQDVVHAAHWQSSQGGGHGAVRQMAETLLKASGRWEKAVSRFYE
ncbi:MAG: HAD hydrolase family protein [Magnetococcales bacterium]|nr:HAD hydrolase family protein [Magnetococcales bacterium]